MRMEPAPETTPIPSARPLRILMLEDTPEDAELNSVALLNGGISFTSLRVETRADFLRALDEFQPDIILSDYRLPAFDGREALQVMSERASDVPVIMVTGAVGDELAVELLHGGARDYVLKDRLARLPSAVQRALDEARLRREREAAERALRESEARHRSFIAASPDGVGVIDPAGKVIFASPKIHELLGLERGLDLRGTDAFEWIAAEDRERARTNFARNTRGEIVSDADYRLVRRDGTPLYVEMNGAPIFDADNRITAVVTVVRDATARREAVEALRRSEQKYRTLFEESWDGLFITDAAGCILDMNRRGIEMLGYGREAEILELRLGTDLYEHPEEYADHLARVHAEGTAEFEVNLHKRGGEIIVTHCYLTAVRDRSGAVQTYRGIFRDITEKKRADEALRRSEEHLREVYEKSPLAYQSLDEMGHFIDVNPAWCVMMGYRRDEVVGRAFAEFMDAASRAQASDRFARFLREGEVHGIDFEMVRKDGTRFEIELDGRIACDEQGRFRQTHCILRDVTERKRSEQSLRRFNRALKTLSSGNEVLVRARTEQALLDDMCRVLIDDGGYRSVWIGLAKPGETMVTPQAWAGHQGGCFTLDSNCLQLPSADDPVTVALSTGAPCVTRDIEHAAIFDTCREDAMLAGFKASVALPLVSNQGALGALTIYAAELDAFDEEEVKLLMELAGDLTYGMHALRTRADKERGLIRLQAAMDATIQALANTVELRDPYTAGHQQRVAQLVTALARRMGFPEDRVRGLRLAAMVHDVGKINVPAEILSRPGKLSAVEYSIVKTHVEAGYEILHAIDFPWPIADIVHQHHERLDGSGYPQGLKDGAILQEARIMAVADVVEAMTNHRPYRASLGLESAMEEIQQGGGRLYDTDVVRVCVELFRRGEFRFQ